MAEEMKQDETKSSMRIIVWVLVGLVIVSLGGYAAFQYKLITDKNTQLSQLTEEKTVLENDKTTLNAKIGEITTTVNDIALRIQDVKQRNVAITQLVTQTAEGGQKDQILADITAIEGQLQHDKQQLDGLMVKMKESGIKIASLEAVIKSLKSEIVGHVERIENLKSIVEHKNEVIKTTENALSKTQNELQVTKASLDMTVQELTDTKNTLEETKNTAYYVIGSKNQLKDMNVINETGWFVFNKDIDLAANINESVFRRIDITEQTEFTINRNIDQLSILPERVESSYTIEKIDKDQSVLKVTDPEQFWKIKYLAILVKGSEYQTAMAGN